MDSEQGHEASRSVPDADKRIGELEKLVSSVRHDVNGALTPALMVADRLRSSTDPQVRRAGEKIGESILRVTKILKATRDTVPPMRSRTG